VTQNVTGYTSQPDQENKKGLFKKTQWTRRTSLVAAALTLIIVVGAFLRFYKLGASGVGNTYYAATVKSMLTSWRNFFFVAFEPGGSVSVDKPPLGFWLQALSASIFGLNGFALAFPQALAGVFSIPLLFSIVKKQFGDWVGLISALVLAIMPVAVSTDRNNTIDGLLVFVLLLAVWAILKSVRTGKFRWLLLGAVFVGLGFNIKMLQAFMPLLGLYALYLFGAKHSIWKRIAHLALATLVLLAISFSWAVAVDLTPAADRPYVGSSTNNSELELIFGWNGLLRIMGMFGKGRASGADPNIAGGLPQLPPGQVPDFPGGVPLRLPNRQQFPYGFQPGANGQLPPLESNDDGGAGARGGMMGETQPGVLRLFTMPLADQASWLLPIALLGILLIVALRIRKWAGRDQLLGVLLWGGWLLPMLAYFSFTTGLFHSYYLIMLGPGIAALVGAAAWGVAQVFQHRRWIGFGLAVLFAAVTLAFEAVLIANFNNYAIWLIPVSVGLAVAGLGFLAWNCRPWMAKLAVGLLFAGLLLAPLTWCIETATSTANSMLPNAGPSEAQFVGPMSDLQSNVNEKLVQYLLANTDPATYLVATTSAMEASPFVLATDRPVLTFGGFTGSDNVVDAAKLAQLVSEGKLRFVLADDRLNSSKSDILTWVKANCSLVDLSTGVSSPGGMQQVNNLYDCGNQ
jgi:4-amino-4-deoxy-L-arabinose transferase-like glycosyltransferase